MYISILLVMHAKKKKKNQINKKKNLIICNYLTFNKVLFLFKNF